MALETPPLTKVTACTTTEATIENYILTPKDGFNLTNILFIFFYCQFLQLASGHDDKISLKLHDFVVLAI